MSSHHIVREKQEPALLVLNLAHFDQELLGQLLEWSPTVIATPITVWQLLVDDIHVDWLLTDEAENPTQQTEITLIPSAADSWLANAMKTLIAKSYPAVNVIADEFKPEQYIPYLHQLNIVIYRKQQKIYAVKSGFEKWKPAGSIVQLLNQPDDLKCNNLDVLKEGRYQVKEDGFVKLEFEADCLFIVEYI